MLLKQIKLLSDWFSLMEWDGMGSKGYLYNTFYGDMFGNWRFTVSVSLLFLERIHVQCNQTEKNS